MFARLFLYRLISRCAHAHSPHSDSCWKDTITPLWWATGQCFFLRGEVPLVFRFIPVVRKLAGKETSGQCHNKYTKKHSQYSHEATKVSTGRDITISNHSYGYEGLPYCLRYARIATYKCFITVHGRHYAKPVCPHAIDGLVIVRIPPFLNEVKATADQKDKKEQYEEKGDKDLFHRRQGAPHCRGSRFRLSLCIPQYPDYPHYTNERDNSHNPKRPDIHVRAIFLC
mmetsp:Transcript_19007/g.48529  ORF Transcript_19007/g.48529 Transcript_19007/m.48529 type:complete len:227 (+) Transcript_19007:624-1304(+)